MTDPTETAALIRARAGNEPVALGLILGSGLGHLAHAVDGPAIPYADLPGFPHVGVSGHNPHLHIGLLEGVRVAVFGHAEMSARCVRRQGLIRAGKQVQVSVR